MQDQRDRRVHDQRERRTHDPQDHAPVGAAAYVAARHAAEAGGATGSPAAAPDYGASSPAPAAAPAATPAASQAEPDRASAHSTAAATTDLPSLDDRNASRDSIPPALMTPDQLALVPAHARDGLMTEMDPKRRAIVDVLRSIYDPEIPVNIYDIGLIYDIQMRPDGRVGITMTLTSPMCPVAETLPPEVQNKVSGVDGVSDVDIDLVWEPGWTPVMMSEDAKLLLNIM